MKHVLLTLTLFVSFFASAQIVNIPDANFKNALLNHNPVIDTNGDGEIQVSEAENFDSILNVNSQNISDLTGIEFFINIDFLLCSENQLTQLDLSQNLNLTLLSVSNNLLTSLNITNNHQLFKLNCNNNQLTSLDTSQNENLQYLRCFNNLL